jgi:hypothetical protein
MSKTEERPVEDHNIANLDRHAGKIIEQIKANAWRLLATPDLDLAEMRGLYAEQVELQNVLNWFGTIKDQLRPPRIVNPGQSNGMKLVN